MATELFDIINGWVKKDTDMYFYEHGFSDDYVEKDLTESQVFNFMVTDFEGREVHHSYRMKDDATYNEVADQFAEFLSSVYGYTIKLKATT